MNKQVILKKTISNIKRLPASKVEEVNDFVQFLLNKIEDQLITEGIQEIVSNSKSYDFLKEEPELYSVKDLKVKYK